MFESGGFGTTVFGEVFRNIIDVLRFPKEKNTDIYPSTKKLIKNKAFRVNLILSVLSDTELCHRY